MDAHGGRKIGMAHVEKSISVQKPLDEVWRYLTDFTNTEEWDPPTVSTTRLSGDGGVGTVYRNVSNILGNNVEIEYTVSAMEPMIRFEVKGATSHVDLHDTITFDWDGPMTVVTYRAEFAPQGAAKLAEPLLPLGLKKLGDDAEEQMAKCLRRL